METNSGLSAAGMLSLLPLLLLLAGPAFAAGFAVKRRKRAGGAPETVEKPRVTVRRPQRLLILIALALLAGLYILGVALYGYKGFGSLQMFLDLLRSNAGLICVVCGMTCVMITGGVDFSVGSLVGLVCMVVAAGMEYSGLSPTLLVPAVLVFGAAFGLLQGYLIGCLKVKSYIVTLAGLYIFRALTNIIGAYSKTFAFAVTSDTWFLKLAQVRISIPIAGAVNGGGATVQPYLSVGVLIAFAVLILTFLLLRYTRLGRDLYAAGDKRQGALAEDGKDKRSKLIAYTLCGLMASIGGVLYCMHYLIGFVSLGKGMEMNAISSAIIGGVLMTGGAGSVLGAFIGVLVNGLVSTLVSYNPDLSRLGSALPNIAAGALAMLFMAAQRVVLKGQTEEDQPEPPQETLEQTAPPVEMNDAEFTE